MSRNVKIILVFLFTHLILISSAQTFQWAVGQGDVMGDVNEGLAVDASGNCYSIGYFAGTVDFDPGVGVFNMTSAGSADIFICELNSSGSLVWAKQMGGSMTDFGLQIALDGSGNVLLTGYFAGTADFDPGIGVSNLTSIGSDDIFIAKLDGNGNFQWAKSMGSTIQDWGFYIAADASDNVYTTGFFNNTVDFDPGTGVFNLTASGSTSFVCKFDANGNFVWAAAIGSSSFGQSIALDASGNVYSTGYFAGPADFDPGNGAYNLTSNGGLDVYVSKLDGSGNFVWAKQMGGTGNEQGVSISVDGGGNVYSSGLFEGTVDFDPGIGVTNLTAANGVKDSYISKLDANGNFIWVKQLSCNLQQFATVNAISLVANFPGEVYISGYFYGTIDFDPGSGAFNLTNLGAIRLDAFVLNLDAGGNFIWAIQLGDTLDELDFGVAVNSSGSLYTSGSFQSTVDFDPGIGVTNLTSLGNNDAFVCKFTNIVSVNENTENEMQLSVFPNPFEGNISLVYSGRYQHAESEIFNSIGEEVGKWQLVKGQNEIQTMDLSAGIYFLQVRDESGTASKKIIKH